MIKPAWAALCLSLAAASAQAMELKSPDLANGAQIAREQIYPRCGGKNISPALSWSGVPAGTKTLAVTLIDTSVKPSGWSHWIVTGLPPDTASLPKGVKAFPDGASAIVSNFGDPYYDGPCPPPGSGVHRYEFTVWALKEAPPAMDPNETGDALRTALMKIAIAHATLTGTVSG